MATIKAIKLLGRLLTLAGGKLLSFLNLILKFFFYNSLIRVYYGIFRLKKNEMAGKSFKDFFKREFSGFTIFALVAITILSNLISSGGGIKAANAKLTKTTAASLITADFDTNIEEELIEEKLSPAIIADAKQKQYEDEYPSLEKDAYLNQEDDFPTSWLAFNESNDVILKPTSLSLSDSENKDQTTRTEIIEYTVQIGDTVSSIASRFGLTVNTVLWANNLSAYSLIRPGDTLSILPYSGLLYSVKSGDTISKIAKTYDISTENIIAQNKLNENIGLKIGQKLILPGAKKITTSSSVAKTNTNSSYTGVSVIKDLVKAPPATSSAGSMAWPAVGHRITQYFSWRHNGIDIANKVGTAIYAAEAGTVEIAAGGWNGGYGNTILINHGGGKKTRYGHLSKLYVEVGDKVEKGENIGAMGSTGRSTGSHLHFEIIINGTRYNPLNYVK